MGDADPLVMELVAGMLRRSLGRDNPCWFWMSRHCNLKSSSYVVWSVLLLIMLISKVRRQKDLLH
jgi:hypothetical protein